MRFQVERDALADAVAWTARTLPSRPPVPILAGLLLGVAGTGLTLSAFDYEVSAEAELELAEGEDGQALVSGRLLAEICRSLPGTVVEMAAEGSRMSLHCGSARFLLPLLPVEEYPTLPQMPTASGTIGSDAFAAAVTSVAIAAGRDDTLPVLTGVRIEIDGENLMLVATDRYRLAVRELPWQPQAPGITATALVPARTLAETARALTSGAEVTMALAGTGSAEGMVGFAGGRRRTTTRLLDGEFPKYESLLPTEFAATTLMATATLVEAVKRVSLVAARNTPVRLSFSTDTLELEAGGADEAQALERLETEYDGEPMTVAFNPGFLLDGLGAIDSDVARLAFTSPSRPAVITGKDSGADYRYLLMPVRLSG